ncbi:MAG: type II secretion system F family protein [bacterium]
MGNATVFVAIGLAFLAALLGVLGGGEALANRVAREKGLYERLIGKELYRLFLDISPQEFFLLHLLFLIMAIVISGIMIEDWTMGVIVGGLIGYAGPKIYLKRAWSNRIKELDSQVEESMIYMSNSFKANPALPDAIQDVINSMGPPITQELSVLLKEYKLGTPLDTALINMQQRVPSRNLQLAVSALIIGRTVGGNIPKILEDIASTIRESFRLERVIDTQTAQGKMQAWVMGLMPAVVVMMFYLMDPELITPLFETLPGYAILAVAALLNVIGVVFILKIVRIQV